MVLAWLLCLGLLNQTAFAQTPTVFTGSHWSEFEGGAKAVCNDADIDNDDDGLIELCYLGDLDAMRYQLDGTGLKRSADGSKSTAGCPSNVCKGYELVRDLDFNDDDSYRDTANRVRWTSGDGWVPIGKEGGGNTFRGIFEGNGHTLSNLTINTITSRVGLFGFISFPSVVNGICLVNINVRGDGNLSSLVGHNAGKILNSCSSGQISSTGSSVGGLVGLHNSSTSPKPIISNSYSRAQVIGNTLVGGLVGQNHTGEIFNSYSMGYVTGSEEIGGLVGHNNAFTSDSKIDIVNCYSSAQVSGKDKVGGLIGNIKREAFSFLVNSYSSGQISSTGSNVGGLIGLNPNVGFIDANSSTKTTAQLQAPTGPSGIYSTWSSVAWDFGTSTEYPAVKYTTFSSVTYPTCGTSQQPPCGRLLPGQGRIQVVISTETSVRTRAYEGDAVVLDATRDGNITYQWSQIGSDSLGLTTVNAATLRFVIPSDLIGGDAKEQTLTLQLKVGGDINSATTISIVVKKIDNGPMTPLTITRINARRLTFLPGPDPDGIGTSPAYLWQKCLADADCNQENQWQPVSGDATSSSYQIQNSEIAENNQFRVQLAYTDGQNYQTTVTSTPYLYTNQKPVITDIEAIATTEGEVVTIVAEVSDANFDELNYLWRVTAGDRTSSILAHSTVTGTTLTFTIPTDWTDTAQTTLSLLISVGDGVATSTKSVIVNITRTDNGEWTTKPTISELDRRLTISALSAALATDPDGDGTIEAYQWQRCLANEDCDQDGQWKDIRDATKNSYQIPKDEAANNQFRVQFTYRDGQNYQTIVTSEPVTYVALRILDIEPLATTEGEIVTIVARVNVSSGNLIYVWSMTTGDKTPNILKDSPVTSATLVFTVPSDWASTAQTTLSLLVSVSDGETTGTNLAIVNITRIDNGGLATTPTITRSGNKLTVSADLDSDPDGGGTVQAYQWQLCRSSSATVACDNDNDWGPAPGAQSTASSYIIPEGDAVKEGDQFRVQLTYNDGQDYRRMVISEAFSYQQTKAIFMRLKLFLEGALQ